MPQTATLAISHARTRATRDARPDLPNPHNRSWRGIARLPSRMFFTREQYREWMKRGMVPRGYVLGYEREAGYFFAVEPPRALKFEEAPAEVSQHETPTEGPASGESGAGGGDASVAVGPREPAARGGEERDEEGEEE